ncbi:hypothetical protein Mgra_00006936 [Meloidogyne graminicola]|uniref:Uncharacterized protein n=1 Tax=Meloidogyne graminicola TaxID=189291 RepID=A0A8S9ZK07_9BILA|nr:hypothetical protein Mgra_00006936 [Meloidogyne graminicola]
MNILKNYQNILILQNMEIVIKNYVTKIVMRMN